MSDYVRAKVVRIPFPQWLLEKCNTDNPWDCENFLEEKLEKIYNTSSIPRFEIGLTDKAFYLDWVYYYTYGEESGEYGHVRKATDKEYKQIMDHFWACFRVIPEYTEIRIVDYCYYNCYECPDYYDLPEVKEEEDFKFIKIDSDIN